MQIIDLSSIIGASVKTPRLQSRINLFRGSQSSTATTNVYINPNVSGVLPFTYHAQEWSSPTFSAEINLGCTNTSVTVYAGIWDVTANAVVTGSEVSTNQTSSTVRSGSITLVDGHAYIVYQRTNNSSYACYVYGVDILAMY